MKRIGRRSGFTLLELIIVMGLMAVIAAMGQPQLSAALSKRATSAAADQFISVHALARATAVRYGRVAQLHIDVTGNRIWVDVDTSANNIGQRATTWYLRSMAGTGPAMASNRSLICFDARGLATTGGSCESGDLQVIFSQMGKADTVRTSALGKVLR